MKAIQATLERAEQLLNRRPFGVFVPLAIIAVVVIFFYWLQVKYNVNVPAADDYGIALDFLNKFTHAESFSEKLNLLFMRHSEHRLVIPKLLILLAYFIQGKADFFTYVIIGNLGLLAIAAAFYKMTRTGELRVWLFTPVVLALFQLQHWENSTFPTPSIQTFYVIFFALVAFYCLGVGTTRAAVIAIIALVAGVLTSGSGIFAIAPAAFILIVQKRFKILALLLTVAAIVAWLYFREFEFVGNTSASESLLQKPIEILTMYFAALGGFINFGMPWSAPDWGYPAAVCAGALMTIFFFYLTWKKYFLQSPALYASLLLFLITIALLALFRSAFYSYSASMISAVSRYRIVSECAVIVCYIALIEIVKPGFRWLLGGIFIVAGIWYNTYSYERNFDMFKVNIESVIETSVAIYANNRRVEGGKR